MKEFILSLDQGTSSSRAVIFDKRGDIISISQKEFKQHFPHPGWVEHSPEEIWASQYAVMSEAMASVRLTHADIATIGITNQRETTVLWNADDGKPVYNAIVWQDRRTSEICDKLRKNGLLEMIRRRTGLLIDPYFSATKIRWILDNVPIAKQLAEKGKLRFGTVDSWLLWNLTEGKVHITDVTNASRTMLFNINTLEWDKDILELLNIPVSILPVVKSSSEIYGFTNLLGGVIPISGIAGDQQAALFGQICVDKGDVKNTYGTGCFLLMNIGEKASFSSNNLLTTIACQINGRTTYALEGSVFTAGAVVQWLRDGLGIIKSSSEIEQLALSVPDNGGVYFVPALSGLGAPYWDPHATGTMTGITRGTTSAHIARAALEGIAFQTMDVVTAMAKDAKIPISMLKVDGGASRNNFLMQFQSDILNTKVLRPKNTETTALGAAFLSGLAVGYWSGMSELKATLQLDREFSPSVSDSERERTKSCWVDAVSRSLSRKI